MIYTTDDVSIDNLKHFKFWDKVKERKHNLRVVAFVVAKDIVTPEFNRWFSDQQDWVEIGVHCYEHSKPQEGWREDQEQQIQKAINTLKPYLPKRYLYRPPGFRFLPQTEPILKRLGFAGIAHQQFIKIFDTWEKIRVFNTHCTENEFNNPIGKIWQKLT